MKARYKGFCNECMEYYEPGTEILKSASSKKWIHKNCNDKLISKKNVETVTTKYSKCKYCGKFSQSKDGFHAECKTKMISPPKYKFQPITKHSAEKPDFKCDYCKKITSGKNRGGDFRPSGKKFENLCKECSREINYSHVEPKNLHNKFEGR